MRHPFQALSYPMSAVGLIGERQVPMPEKVSQADRGRRLRNERPAWTCTPWKPGGSLQDVCAQQPSSRTWSIWWRRPRRVDPACLP